MQREEHLWPGGVKGYEKIVWLMLFNMVGNCLSGRLPALPVCMSWSCIFFKSVAAYLISGLLMETQSSLMWLRPGLRPPSHA